MVRSIETPLRRDRISRVALTLGASILMAGCAGEPPPTTQLAVARTAVQDAARDGAAQGAPQEFASAQAKLARAEEAEKSGNNTDARRMAEEAEADAHVAAATARAQGAQAALNSVNAGNAALRQEIQQQPPAAAPAP